MPFAQCKLVYRWAAHVYKNHSLMQRADEMPAHDVGAGGALYYTFGLTVDDWVSLVYPSAAASRLGGLKTDDAIADGVPYACHCERYRPRWQQTARGPGTTARCPDSNGVPGGDSRRH
jgi:hypothetical protein